MEKRILKWSCIVTAFLMVITLSFLMVYPQIHARMLLSEEKEFHANQPQYDVEETLPTQAAFADVEEVLEESQVSDGRIHIQLPEGTSEDDVKVTNDYLTQTVSVQFPSDCKDYFAEYHVKGSSAHIASIAYYNSHETGVLLIGTPLLFEVESNFEGNELLLTFVDPHDIYEKVIVVDAGHGGRAAGATRNNICEKDVDLAIVLALKKIIEESDENIGVYFTRLDDANPTLMQRADLANAAQADLFISVHNNASTGGGYSYLNGTQVLYSESQTGDLASERFARICLEKVCASCESRSVGLLPGDEIYIIRSSKVPVALIEVGFMSSKSELEKLATVEYQTLAAQGIFDAILAAFEEGY